MSKPAPRNKRHPDAIILYAPNDECTIIGVHYLKLGEIAWKFSPPTTLPTADMNGFIGEMMKVRQMTCIDIRLQSELKSGIKGISAAIPVVLVAPGIDAAKALRAAAKLHQAILDAPDD